MASSLDDASSVDMMERVKTQMLQRLSKTDAHFRHQQRGEPDLLNEEKANIALDILNTSPAKFLERFYNYLVQDDVLYFKDLKDNYMVHFYLKEIEKRCADTSHRQVKNRRYLALQQLMKEGEYFSQNEMKWRDPLLFDQMVGQFETQREKDDREVDKNDLKFSSILLTHLMDASTNKDLYDRLKEEEACQDEEEDEESSDEESEVMEETAGTATEENADNAEGGEGADVGEPEADSISESERLHLKEEFLHIMQERFLCGDDKNFDYSAVDFNADYDALDILTHDAEEKYFDGEDSESAASQCSSPVDETGVGGVPPAAGACCVEMDIRCGLKSMDLVEKADRVDEEEEDLDYMNYEPSEELVKQTLQQLGDDSSDTEIGSC